MNGSQDTLSDGGYITGTYDVVIDGFPYTIETSDHDLPVSIADANKADGSPKGGAAVKGKQKLSVKILAIAGIDPPSQLKAFPLALNRFPSKWWFVGNLKISGSNDGAKITTYTAEITQHINTPT